ncbi:hypothetical protein [Amycolatopsis decaplanina]|nr:hypothetical protein [Amycolatopsis decaplanina]
MARRALIVACSEYADEQLDDLPVVRSDATVLAGVLGDPAIGDFEVECS